MAYQKTGYHPLRGKDNPRFKTERNELIIKLLKSGIYTLEDIGKMMHLTRERVRQIWVRDQKTPFRVNREIKQKIKQERLARTMKQIAFTCKGCGKRVRNSEKNNKHAYCDHCYYLYKVKQIDVSTTIQCTGCGKLYHPWRNFKFNKNRTGLFGSFHSMSCYLEYRKRMARGKNHLKQIFKIEPKFIAPKSKSEKLLEQLKNMEPL